MASASAAGACLPRRALPAAEDAEQLARRLCAEAMAAGGAVPKDAAARLSQGAAQLQSL